MSRRKQEPSLAGGVLTALVLATAGAAVLAALTPLAGLATAARLVVAATGGAYVLYTLTLGSERVGRVTTMVVWAGCALAAWLLGLPFAVYVLVHAALVWLVRALYRHSSLLTAGLDLGLNALAVAFAAWAAARTGSAWLALWCFFLVQALHAAIPASLAAAGRAAPRPGARFERAHRAAEAALRRLTTAQ